MTPPQPPRTHEASHEDSYFDRTVCSCGAMHTRCTDCGQPLDRCGFTMTGARMEIEGPVTLVEFDTDPGDMGEPQVVTEDGRTLVVVPPRDAWGWSFEAAIWKRLEPWLTENRAELSIYPAYPLADGGFGPWTARVLRQRRAGKQNRYDRLFGEGPTRLAALRELAVQLVGLDD